MFIGIAGDDKFVGLGFFKEGFELATHCFAAADDGCGAFGCDSGLLKGIGESFDGVDGRRKGSELIADETQDIDVFGGREMPRFSVCVGGEHGDTNHSVGLVKNFRWLEAAAIDVQRRQSVLRGEMSGESEGEPKMPGELRAEAARSEKPDGDVQSCSGEGANVLVGFGFGEQFAQFGKKLRKIVATAEFSAQSAHCWEIGSGSASQAKIDAAGIQAFQRAELFGDDEWSMVREHDAARADADGGCSLSNVTDEDGCGRACD